MAEIQELAATRVPWQNGIRAITIAVMLRYALITAVAVALATSAQATATIQKPKALTVTGGRCQLKADGTLGVNIGYSALERDWPAKPRFTLATFLRPGHDRLVAKRLLSCATAA